jgi:predicted dinucleotide-binding enzyme
MQKIAILGSGQVGEVLANGFLKHEYAVMRASREPGKLLGWASSAGARASTGTFAEAARWAELVVLAVKGGAAEDAIGLCGLEALAGKTVIDATNPIADAPPVNGVLSFFTGPNDSLMERLQRKAPEARFVKAFSCVGNSLMINPALAELPSMFICGNDLQAKAEVKEILTKFGWETEDCGSVEAARAIEPLCMLWCIPGMLRGDWRHAYRVLR